jgi:hypothetical protein
MRARVYRYKQFMAKFVYSNKQSLPPYARVTNDYGGGSKV